MLDTAAELLDGLDTETEKVRRWRCEQLERIVGDRDLAAFLEAQGVDWQAVERARAAGATLRQIYRIFA